MIPSWLGREIEPYVGRIVRAAEVGGGSIATAFRIDAAKGRFFLKTASGTAGDGFEAEAAGLRALREAASGTELRVPEVVHVRNRQREPGLLLLEWIPVGRPGPNHWRRLGEGLAALHRRRPIGAGRFGFPGDNFIGATPQPNGWMDRWPDFFRDRRLLPQIERARRTGRWQRRWDPLADRLLDRLDELLPNDATPSLLHGDLWSGNQVADERDVPWLVDPAVYVGHREADLAMTELFGGFADAFYDAYEAAWPLDPGYEERRDLYNLYHLLNHLNLFGSSYAAGVERTLRRYGG